MTERSLSYRALAARLRQFGAIEDAVRGKGAHRMWFRRLADGTLGRCPVPFHGTGTPLARSIVRNVRRSLGLSEADGVTDHAFYEG